MADISLSAASRSALFSLSSIQDQIEATQSRLASGKRVASAIDNPTSFFLAAGLSSRANALNGLMDGITGAQSAVTAANKGITAIQSLLTSAQSIANQALQSAQALVTVSGTNVTPLAANTVIASTTGSSTKLKTGDTFTVNDGTTTATYTAANNDTAQTLINAINGTAGLKVAASLNGNGQLQFAATSNVNVTIGGTTTGTGTIVGVLGVTTGATAYATNTVRSGLAAQFDSLRAQIDLAVSDASFNGVNFLTGGSSTVTLNETGTSKLTITGSQATSTALGVVASTNTFQLDTDINTALANITKGLSSLQTISTTLSSMATVMQTRVDFNKAMMDTLSSGADALTANDANADGAILLALQTRQQIAATSLSLTRGGDSSVLRLFGVA
jgi:flagellin